MECCFTQYIYLYLACLSRLLKLGYIFFQSCQTVKCPWNNSGINWQRCEWRVSGDSAVRNTDWFFVIEQRTFYSTQRSTRTVVERRQFIEYLDTLSSNKKHFISYSSRCFSIIYFLYISYCIDEMLVAYKMWRGKDSSKETWCILTISWWLM